MLMLERKKHSKKETSKQNANTNMQTPSTQNTKEQITGAKDKTKQKCDLKTYQDHNR